MAKVEFMAKADEMPTEKSGGPPALDVEEGVSSESSIHEGELKRIHTFWSLLAYQTTVLSTWSCNIILYAIIFSLGGPVALIYGTIIVAIGQTLVMASLAEYCSLWPNAGGQAFYTQMVAPEKYRRFLSYTVSYCVLVCEVSVAAGCALNSANIVNTFVDITHPNIEWKPYMTFLIYCGFLILPLITGVLAGSRYGAQLQFFAGCFNVGGLVVWAIVFLVMAEKTDAKFVFTDFINNSGWNSDAWVFILSFYTPIYGLYGTDGVMHLSEEMKNPSRDAPRVMIWSMVWAGVTALLSGIIMCYTVGPNWEARLDEGAPYLVWFMDVTNSVYGGGVFCCVTMMGLNYLTILNQSTASARMVWKMAKQKAFPCSGYLSHISPHYNIPIRALVAFIAVCMLVGLLVLGSQLAFFAILSGGGIAIQISFIIPILCVVLRGRDTILPQGRPQFNLGKTWGNIINIVSLAWSILVVLFYVFPQYMPVVGEIANMNWAIAIIGAVTIFAGVTWVARAKSHYIA
ncbi:hypothetical protein H2204_000834 [Knufia peltigerae]|uniref:Amino acid transporter n=1 Tax=Knufia peltigerae TaxID=1002370 RepID=A0AA39D368_9EURO|nr:hypothetical protein H2204_000834 [Knufia peltigerae]